MRRRSFPPLLLPLLGLWIGGFLAPFFVGRLSPPVPPDPAHWTVIIPGRDAGFAAVEDRTGRVDGGLLLSLRAFGRADMLVPKDTRPLQQFQFSLLTNSDPVYVNCRSPEGRIYRIGEFKPGAWRRDQTWIPTASAVFTVEMNEGVLWIEGQRQQNIFGENGTLEIAASGKKAWLRSIRLWDTSKTLFLEEDFSGFSVNPLQRLLSALGGLFGGALLGGMSRFRALSTGILWLIPPALVLYPDYPFWQDLCERLYLLEPGPALLRLSVFALSFLPLVLAMLAKSEWLELEEEDTPTKRMVGWGGWCLLVAGVGSRGSPEWFLVGLAFLPLPLLLRSFFSVDGLFLRDLPSQLLILFLGWKIGWLPAIGWRFFCILQDSPKMVEKNPAPGARYFFVLFLLTPFATEAFLRAGPTNEQWDSRHLLGATIGEKDQGFSPFWQSTCKNPPRKALYAFGGSSTGGAYQFRNEPSAFFVARLHEKLCSRFSVDTSNYGDSGRDSFDISRAAPALYAEKPPSVVIYYGGVNDLLTRDAPLTRKERFQILSARSDSLSWIDAIGQKSRLLTGLGLLLRAPENSKELVVAVPLQDAEENLRSLANETLQSGGKLFLVPEYADPQVQQALSPYWDLEKRLASEIPGVFYVDVYANFQGKTGMLVDRNHLSREGAEALATLLQPMVENILAEEP